MNNTLAVLATALSLTNLPVPVLADAVCPPKGMDTTQLLELKAAEFEVADAPSRNRLAIDLLGCVGHPNPEIRDGVVFEAYTSWLRAEALDSSTVHTLADRLGAGLTAPDPDGFLRPFAALDLSEVVRTDRVQPHFSDGQRAALVALSADYLASVTDYRGYSDGEGWRHGVAHGADLVLQWVLNPAVSSEQMKRLMASVSSQVSANGEASYVFGEPERLARPVYYAYRRGELDEAFWETWFAEVGAPAPLAQWSDAWKSEKGLALRHNTLAFFSALHLMASSADDERTADLVRLSLDAIKRLY